MRMRMTKDYKKFRRDTGMAEFERNCRLCKWDGRLVKAYRVPGTYEAGRWYMYKVMAEDSARREGWSLYEPVEKEEI